MAEKLTEARLAELQAQTFPAPIVTVDIGNEEDARLCQEYMNGFLAEALTCPCCCAPTEWKWRIHRGEAGCVHCGYPMRVLHYVPTADGTKELHAVALYYQPRELSFGGACG